MHDGWVRLEDISIRGSGAAGGGCCGTAMQKTLDVRACLPRGALVFAFSGHFPLPTYFFPTYFSLISPVPAPRNFLRVRTGGPGVHRATSDVLPLALPCCAPTQPSPLTPSNEQLADLAEGHSGHKRPTHPSPQPRAFIEFSHFNLFCLPGLTRSSDLSITCILGQHACTTTRTKHVVFPVTRPQIGFFTKHHQLLSGQFALRAPCRCLWRSSRPPARDRAFVFPRRPCPPPPARSTFHRDHHMPIPSSHVHLSSTTYGDQHDPLVSQAPATITFCIRVF